MSKPFDLPTLSGAERIFVALFPDTELSDIPSDIEDTVKTALSALTERSADVMRMYYYEGLTMPQIASEKQISPDKVRCIINRSLTVLKNKAHASYIKHGEAYYRGERYKRLQNEIAFEQHEVEKLEKLLSELKTRKEQLKEEICKELSVEHFEDISEYIDTDKVSVSNLDLSARARNALRINGIYTVGDLRSSCKKKGALSLRGVGPKSIEEIKQAVFDKTGIPLLE